MAGFAHDLCAAREAEARKACRYGVRVVELRFGLVLAAHGGPLGAMMPAFEFGLGSRFGNGRQWMPWLHLDDAVRMIAFAIARDDLRGPLNAVAPEPVRNATFARQLAGALGRPCLFALPAPLIRAGLGEMGQELLLNSRRVLPMRMEQAGFRFLAPTLAEAPGPQPGARTPQSCLTSSSAWSRQKRAKLMGWRSSASCTPRRSCALVSAAMPS